MDIGRKGNFAQLESFTAIFMEKEHNITYLFRR